MSEASSEPKAGKKKLDIRQLAISSLFDEVPGYISIQDREFLIVDANSKFVEDFGDRMGERCHSVYKDRADKCPECPVDQSFADGREHSGEHTIFDRRGLPHNVFVNTKPLRDHTGHVVAVMEVFTDITVTKELQNRLHDSLNRFHMLFEQVPCFISVQDRDFRVVEANRLFKESFGGRLGGHCYEIYKKRTERCEKCPVAHTFEDGEVHCSEELVVDTAGNELNVLVYTAPVRNRDGEITAVIETSTDITEIRMLQDRLVSLGQLVAGIAHSIKNVIEGLRGGIYVGNLGFRDNNMNDVHTGWDMVQRNVNRVSGMIMDMLYCAKERVPRRLPVEVGKVAAEAAEMYRVRANDCGIDLAVNEQDGIPAVLGEPKDIHALLSNLISNAIDACCSDENSEKKHRVDVNVRRDDGAVTIEVRDNGMGIDDETRRKLFIMFYSTKGAFGTGLGLLVAHKVAVEHGGTITVESQPGEGAAFTVRLPIPDEISGS